MSTQETGQVRIQVKVVTDGAVHLSNPTLVTPEDITALRTLVEQVTRIGRNDGGQFNIETKNGWTFIPTRNINWITITRLSGGEQDS